MFSPSKSVGALYYNVRAMIHMCNDHIVTAANDLVRTTTCAYSTCLVRAEVTSYLPKKTLSYGWFHAVTICHLSVEKVACLEGSAPSLSA